MNSRNSHTTSWKQHEVANDVTAGELPDVDVYGSDRQSSSIQSSRLRNIKVVGATEGSGRFRQATDRNRCKTQDTRALHGKADAQAAR